MSQENNTDEGNIKVEAASDTTIVQEKRGGERRGGGPGGDRFGRGGRFGGPRGGRDGGGQGGNQRDGGRNFGRGGGRGGNYGGNRGSRQDSENQDGQDGQQDNNQGNFTRRRQDNRDNHGGEGRDNYRGGGGQRPMRGPDDNFNHKMQQINGPSFDIPAVDLVEKKFNGRNRLYIGNIGSDVTDEEITELFKPYGETSEVFLNKDKNFGFVKVDYRSNAEKAKRELDGTTLKNRNLKIRFAPNSATIKVKNLSNYVTNELLHYGFSVFGEIERATVCVDERGKPTGEGIIDFARKGSALHAARKCSEGCFFLTGSLRPCIVESHDLVDDIDGYPERNLNRKNPEYQQQREVGPRFASLGSFEHEFGTRWKQLYDLHHQKEEALKKELELEKEKLEAQMEYAKYEHETEMLREQLRSREMDKERQKREWEMKQRQVEEERLRTEEQMRRTQEDMETRILAQQDELKRRQQENNLFMQASNLDNLLDQQEQAYDTPSYTQGGSLLDDNGIIEPKAFMSSYERHGNSNNNRYDRDNSRNTGNVGGNRGHWVNDSRRGDDFPSKRRRF